MARRLGKTKQELKDKGKELSKQKKGRKQADKELKAAKTQIIDLQVELQKYKDLEAQARVQRAQALQEKQALIDGRVAEKEKNFEDGYNTAIIKATGEMKKIKHFIYQASFDYGLEKAPANHELQKLKVLYPN